MQYFKLLFMSPLLPPLCIIICTIVRKIFYILLVVRLLIYSKKYFLIQQNKIYSPIYKTIIITSPIGFYIALTKVDASLIRRCINVEQRCFDFVQRFLDAVSTLGTDIISTLYKVENSTSDFVSYLTSDQRYFNVDPQR